MRRDIDIFASVADQKQNSPLVVARGETDGNLDLMQNLDLWHLLASKLSEMMKS